MIRGETMGRHDWKRNAGLPFICSLGMGVVILLGCHIDARRKCYDRIALGMSFKDAMAILEANGYVVTGGGGDLGETTCVFSRRGTDPTIILVSEACGHRVAYKELDSAPERFLDSIHNFRP
jgi:hypothetical protein